MDTRIKRFMGRVTAKDCEEVQLEKEICNPLFDRLLFRQRLNDQQAARAEQLSSELIQIFSKEHNEVVSAVLYRMLHELMTEDRVLGALYEKHPEVLYGQGQ